MAESNININLKKLVTHLSESGGGEPQAKGFYFAETDELPLITDVPNGSIAIKGSSVISDSTSNNILNALYLYSIGFERGLFFQYADNGGITPGSYYISEKKNYSELGLYDDNNEAVVTLTVEKVDDDSYKLTLNGIYNFKGDEESATVYAYMNRSDITGQLSYVSLQLPGPRGDTLHFVPDKTADILNINHYQAYSFGVSTITGGDAALYYADYNNWAFVCHLSTLQQMTISYNNQQQQ